MNRYLSVSVSLLVLSLSSCGSQTKTLASAYADYFPIGAAFNQSNIEMYQGDLVKEFSSLTCENEMKWLNVHPSDTSYTYEAADKMVAYAKSNNLKMRGHCLVWHEAIPSDLFLAKDGSTISKADLLAKMKDHIDNVVSHFGDAVYCWDVANEVVDDSTDAMLQDGSNVYRNSPWYTICGPEFVLDAFLYAREKLDALGLSQVKLFYNDYGLALPTKREKALAMIDYLQANHCPIDGIGMQSHYHIGSFSLSEFEKSIEAYAAKGLQVQITEFDVDVYDETLATSKNAAYWYQDALPADVEAIQTAIYRRAFQVLRQHKDSVTGVTFWGVADDSTWLDKSPVEGRKNYPYVFGVDHAPKTSYYAIRDF